MLLAICFVLILRERVAAMLQLQSPETLEDLKTCLGVTGYMRAHIPYYGQITAPLQLRKAQLVHESPEIGGPKRKSFAAKRT